MPQYYISPETAVYIIYAFILILAITGLLYVKYLDWRQTHKHA
jgi:hypothetical protein